MYIVNHAPSVHAGPRSGMAGNQFKVISGATGMKKKGIVKLNADGSVYRLNATGTTGTTSGGTGLSQVLSSLITGVTNDLAPSSTTTVVTPPATTTTTSSNTTIYIIIGAVVLVIGVFVFIKMRKK